jgi:hypothetical protein
VKLPGNYQEPNFIGKPFSDKGYISKKLAKHLVMVGVELITMLKKHEIPSHRFVR